MAPVLPPSCCSKGLSREGAHGGEKALSILSARRGRRKEGNASHYGVQDQGEEESCWMAHALQWDRAVNRVGVERDDDAVGCGHNREESVGEIEQ